MDDELSNQTDELATAILSKTNRVLEMEMDKIAQSMGYKNALALQEGGLYQFIVKPFQDRIDIVEITLCKIATKKLVKFDIK